MRIKKVYLSEKQKKEIVVYIRPSLDDYISYQNLDLLVAAYDEETDIYLVSKEYVSNVVSTLGYDSYTYLLLTPSGMYSVYFTNYPGRKDILSNSAINIISDEKVKALIECYHHPVSELIHMRQKAVEGINLGGKEYSAWYLEKMR